MDLVPDGVRQDVPALLAERGAAQQLDAVVPRENDDEFDDDLSDESILDMALTVFHPPRELLWHYRSRHEDLIKFSNTFFANLLSFKQSIVTKFVKEGINLQLLLFAISPILFLDNFTLLITSLIKS